MRRVHFAAIAVAAVVIVTGYVLFMSTADADVDVNVAISPYQDLAMLVNIEQLGLEEAYGTTVDIRTIPWEETYTAVLSAAGSIDLAFASFADYLTKAPNLNRNTEDPLLFLYPAYVFKGGAFVSFVDDVPAVATEGLEDADLVRRFLGHRIGLPLDTLYQMIIHHLADRAGVEQGDLDIVDVGFDAGLLGAQAEDLDMAAVGLTQLTEALERGARVVLDMETLRFADITGFIARKSVLDVKAEHITNVIRMWFDCVDYVLADLDRNSAASLAYLMDTAATEYTLASYKAALSQEFFPRSIADLEREVLSADGSYPVGEIEAVMLGFLHREGVSDAQAASVSFLEIEPK